MRSSSASTTKRSIPRTIPPVTSNCGAFSTCGAWPRSPPYTRGTTRQAAEDFLDTLACKISLDQVAARLASRARKHHKVDRPPLAAQHRLYLITQISRAHCPSMQQRHAG